MYDDNDIFCVPQTTGSPTVDQSKATEIINDFCSSKANMTTFPGSPIDQLISLGAGLDLNISVNAWESCSNSYNDWTIDQGDCQYFLGEALNGCDTNTLGKSGGTIDDACLIWILQP